MKKIVISVFTIVAMVGCKNQTQDDAPKVSDAFDQRYQAVADEISLHVDTMVSRERAGETYSIPMIKKGKFLVSAVKLDGREYIVMVDLNHECKRNTISLCKQKWIDGFYCSSSSVMLPITDAKRQNLLNTIAE